MGVPATKVASQPLRRLGLGVSPVLQLNSLCPFLLQFPEPQGVSAGVRLCDLLGHLQRRPVERDCQEFYRALYIHAQPLHSCLPNRPPCVSACPPWPWHLLVQPFARDSPLVVSCVPQSGESISDNTDICLQGSLFLSPHVCVCLSTATLPPLFLGYLFCHTKVSCACGPAFPL